MHEFLSACRERAVRFVVGHALSAEIARAVVALPRSRWIAAISADGLDEREGAQVAEVTDLVDLAAWPAGTRMIARREEPHPGAQLTFTDIAGYRYQVFLADHPERDICFLEGFYRGRGRAECAIRDAKDTGLAHLPSSDFAINRAWVAVVLLAGDLLAWMKGLCLRGELARAEPKRLRAAARRGGDRALGAAGEAAHRRGVALGRRAGLGLQSAAVLVPRHLIHLRR